MRETWIWKRLRCGLAAGAVWTVAAVNPLFAAEPPAPAVEIPKTATAPVIDGKGDDAAWANAAVAKLGMQNATGEASPMTTSAKLLYDDNALYLLFSVQEPDMAKLESRKFSHDGPVWNYNSIEIYLRPDAKSTDFMQFGLDLAGNRYDALGTDSFGYNPAYDTAVTTTADGWTLEVALPFSALAGTAPKTGEEYRGNFYWNRQSAPEQNSWNATRSGYDKNFDRYGYLIFGSAKTALEELSSIRQQANQDFPDGLPAEVEAIVAKIEAMKNSFATATNAELLADYGALRGKLSALLTEYRDTAFHLQWAKAGLPVAIQPADVLAANPLMRSAGAPPKSLSATFVKDEVRDFGFNLTNLSDQTQIIHTVFRYGEQSSDYFRQGMPGYRIEHFELMPVASQNGEVAQDILVKNSSGILKLAPGETVQLVLSVKALDTAAPETHGFLLFRPIDGKDWKPFELPVDFKTVNASLDNADAPFLSFSFDRVILPLLSERPEFCAEHYDMLKEYGFNTVQICGLMHCPRPKTDADGNFTAEVEYSKLDKLLEFTKNKFDQYYFHLAVFEKLNIRSDLFGIPFDSPGYEKAFKKWIKGIMDHLESRGIDKKQVYICVYDESADDKVLTMEQWIKDVDPEYVTLLDTIVRDPERLARFNPYTDIWMPHARQLNEQSFADMQNYATANGSEMMTYFYCTSPDEKHQPPFPTYTAKFWTCFNQNLTGLAYWAGGQYYGDPLYRKGVKGYDTALLYPTENDVHPSRRLVAWRRGFQDYQLLKLAEAKLAGNTEKLAELREKVRSVIGNTSDTANAERVREFCRSVLAE